MFGKFFRRAARVSGPVLLGLSILFLPASPASAHERRQVGEYELVVGWYDEPAFAEQPNGPEVTINKITKKKAKPVVEGVDLSVEMIFGGESRTFEVEPAFVAGIFGEPGNYNADLFPARPGTWEFHFTGTIEGTEIDETFTSGPETFSDVNDPADVAFPAVDPNNAQLTERIESEADRVSTLASETEDDVSSTRTLSLIGLIVGALGLGVGATLGTRALRKRG